MTYEINTIPLDAVNIKGDTQSRVELNQATIAEYAELIRAAVDLPPVVAFFDGVTFWLADGFHRYFAHKAAGAMEIPAEIREGTKRDAVLFSLGVNDSHGLRRSNEDKRKAIATLLADPEWAARSESWMAETCRVSRVLVRAVLEAAHLVEKHDAVRTVERNGKTYEQNTTNIGKAKSPEAVATPEAPEVLAPFVNDAESLPVTQKETPRERLPESSGDLQELRDKVEELADALKSTLADNEMMGRVFDADDKLKAAMDEAKRQKAIAENAERTLASKSGEFIERARAVSHWQNRAEKAEKALKKLEAAK